ncbi:hypothetical protein PENTCL1PPCAC_3697, partial [Pristionchus entomophagus]
QLNVYEFVPAQRIFIKKSSFSIPIPKHSYLLSKLSPGTVYNITIQAGTSFGYGQLAWTAVSTLQDDEVVLTQHDVTPNSIVLVWPLHWMTNPTAKCTIRAKSLLIEDGLDSEQVNTAAPEVNGN